MRDAQLLDLNSSRSCLLWCRDSPATSVLASIDDEPAALVTAHLRREAPEIPLVREEPRSVQELPMLVTYLNEFDGTERDIKSETWRSRRMVLARDGVGFSFHDTLIHAGTTSTLHYQSHVEAVSCVQGEGTLTNEETGEVHRIEDGMMYLLDGQEKHTVRASTDLRMVCVFNPPVTGRAGHDENGVYPLVVEEPDRAPSAWNVRATRPTGLDHSPFS